MEQLRDVGEFKPGGKVWRAASEVIASGASSAATLLRAEPDYAARAALMSVWGAGTELVNRWLAAGIRSVDALRDAALLAERGVVLPASVARCLPYHEQLERRLTRAEVERMFDAVACAVFEPIATSSLPSSSSSSSRVYVRWPAADAELTACAPCERRPPHASTTSLAALELIACGSYRRGAPTCGDVDIVVTGAAAALDGATSRVVAALRRAGLVLAELSDADGRHDALLVCSARGVPACRVDLRVGPRDELALLTLISTGSAEFNNALALRARACGMKLSRHELLRLFDRNGGKISGALGVG